MKTNRLIFGLLLLLPIAARATVSIEFQLGGIQVPPGSLGVLAADTGANGFTPPDEAAGATLSVGETLGDDVIVAVFSNRNLPDWANLRGFAEHLAVLDYAALSEASSLGVAAGQPLVLHIFPDRMEGDPIRTDEPHLSYTTDEIGDFTPNSTMGFELPADGGAHLLAVIATAQGGEANLDAIDLTELPYGAGSGNFNRGLNEEALHTYFFELAEAGVLTLQGSGAAALRAELRGPSGQLVASSTGGDFAFVENLAAGFYRLLLFRDGGAAGALPYSFSFADSDLRTVVPDVMVGASMARLVGSNVLNGAPGQFAVLVSRRANRVKGYASVANRGELPNQLELRGSPGNAFCAITYLAPGNVTAAMLRGTQRTPLATSASAPVNLQIQFTPSKKRLVKKRGKKKVVAKRTFTSLVRASATGGATGTDAGTIRVKTK